MVTLVARAEEACVRSVQLKLSGSRVDAAPALEGVVAEVGADAECGGLAKAALDNSRGAAVRSGERSAAFVGVVAEVRAGTECAGLAKTAAGRDDGARIGGELLAPLERVVAEVGADAECGGFAKAALDNSRVAAVRSGERSAAFVGVVAESRAGTVDRPHLRRSRARGDTCARQGAARAEQSEEQGSGERHDEQKKEAA
eukprot:CAMPEP_0119351970 /NCGR_PEP_ID=MMETSP1334-20130426/1259_1 /TAXON_ID=127549 /ORGANISM="Calcidiscus leptoporus, Strain RCC1130" /LENGTH=199 /DNA_ID=CAMNT_0007364895 /DNA_START=264 /DNA_END=860 /DNA_ORIENTATION=+